MGSHDRVMETIVVGVDGSEESQRALQWAMPEARARGARVRAVHVWHHPPDYVLQYPPSPPDLAVAPVFRDRDQLEKEAMELLDQTVTKAVGSGPSVDIVQEIDEGSPADRLVRAAAAADAELLVVGSRGLGGFRSLLLGSVSQQLAHHAPCPLVIVRGAVHEPGTGSNTIVVGVDGSPNGEAALHWALEEAHRSGGRVLALHAWSLPSGYELAPYAALTVHRDKCEAGAQALLHDAVTRARGRHRDVECSEATVEGWTAGLLLEAAKGARLLVVGSRGRGGFAGLLLGSVSQQCAHHAPCPIAIVPSRHRRD